jgi:hypothetical protein
MTEAQSQLLAVAYAMLGLSQRGEATCHPIGTFRIVETPESVIDVVVEYRLKQVRQELEEAKQELPEHTFDPDDKEAHERYEDFYLDHYFLDTSGISTCLKTKTATLTVSLTSPPKSVFTLTKSTHSE